LAQITTILIQILRRIIFRHFVLYFAWIGVESIFYAKQPLAVLTFAKLA
jgi:hypothetical protein